MELEKKREYLASVIEIQKAIATGLILRWNWSSEGLYSLNTQNFEFKLVNTSKKKIKYVYITVSIKNPVGDFISKKTLTLVGPIDYKEQGKYEFDNVFYSNIVDKSIINSVKIQYFDGTVKLFSGSLLTTAIVTDEDYSRYLDYKESGAGDKVK